MASIANRSTLAICSMLPTAIDEAGFEALSFTQIKGVGNIGEFGTEYSTFTDNTIGAAPVLRRASRGTTTVDFELIRIADGGQTILAAAINATTSYAYRIHVPGVCTYYFTAAIGSLRNGGLAGGAIVKRKGVLLVDSEVIEVAYDSAIAIGSSDLDGMGPTDGGDDFDGGEP